MLRAVVLTIPVCDGRTDGQTEGQTDGIAIASTALAKRRAVTKTVAMSPKIFGYRTTLFRYVPENKIRYSFVSFIFRPQKT